MGQVVLLGAASLVVFLVDSLVLTCRAQGSRVESRESLLGLSCAPYDLLCSQVG